MPSTLHCSPTWRSVVLSLTLLAVQTGCGPMEPDDTTGPVPVTGSGGPEYAQKADDMRPSDADTWGAPASDDVWAAPDPKVLPCPPVDRLLLTPAGDAVGMAQVWEELETLYVETWVFEGWKLRAVYLYASSEPMEGGLSTIFFPFVDEPMVGVVHSRFELPLEEHGLDGAEVLHMALNARIAAVEEADIDPVEAWAHGVDGVQPSPAERPFVFPRCDG